MKFRKFIAAMTAGIVTAASLFSSIPASAESKQTNSLVIMGDSIATGFGLNGYDGTADSSDESFGSLLAKGCTDKVNYAVDGRKTSELLDSLSDKAVSKSVKKADSVVISIGGNDLLMPIVETLAELASDRMALLTLMKDKAALKELIDQITETVDKVDLKKSKSNISAIFKKIKKLSPDCDVYILTVYNPFEGNKILPELDALAEAKLTTLNKYIKSAAKKYGVKTVDIYSAFKGKAEKYTNISKLDIHPNKAGHALIAKKIKKAGFKMLDKKSKTAVDDRKAA